MHLSKKQEAEAIQVYNTYFDSYMKGDVETIAGLLDDDYSQIGSAEGEVFFNKQDAIQFLYDTIDQVAGKVDMRNRVIKLEQQDRIFVIHEFADLYALASHEWIFYSKFRASTFMQNKNDVWKIIHQHSSFPDARAEEGQNIAVDKIAEENQLLREAVKRRTIELEEKNRDLEIETSLERVRAVAMGMKQPSDMLDVCKVISDQFQLLSIKEIRNVQTAVINESKGTYQNFEYYKLHDKSIITEVDYHHHEMTTAFVQQMLSGPEELFSQSLTGKELSDWFQHQKTTNQFIDHHLATASSLNYYWYSIGPVALGVSTYAPLKEAEINLVKRFRNVFELAYRRFMDIQQAEAQTREAQIQLAMERVRARTMAMQHSDELSEAANLLFQQVQSLGMPAWSAGYCIWDEDKKAITLWMSSEGVLQPPAKVPTTEDELFIQMRRGYEESKTLHVVEMGGEKLVAHYQYMHSQPVVGEILDSIIKAGHPLPTFQIMHQAYFSKGFLLFITYEPVPEAHDIFKRFALVFEQTYTRFLDLQKAEAQANESQIQLALERVRAKTMAMQKSHELSETAVLLFHQLMSLDLNVRGCGFNIWEKDEQTCTSWMSGPDGELSPPFTLPLTQEPLFIRYYESRQKGEDFWVYETGKEELANRYDYLAKLPVLGDAITKELRAGKEIPSFVVDHVVNFSNGNLIFITYERCPEAWDIFKRFGKVFQQTYTRFLDLQKSEAQAREAQIQLALERVRARTMAMQKSDELRETSLVLFQQLKELGEPAEQLTIGIVNETENVVEVFATIHGSKLQQTFRHNIDEPFLMKKVFKGWKAGLKSAIVELAGDELKGYNQFRNELVGSEMFPTNLDSSVRRILHIGYFSKGFLTFATNESRPSESLQLLERFASVFDLTYTRFLDLQNAELQAKEAQIEVALERVRSKTMAMHHSSELLNVINVLSEQFIWLGFNIHSANFNTSYKEKDWNLWLYTPGYPIYPDQIHIPYFDHPYFNRTAANLAKGEDFSTEVFDKKDKDGFLDHLYENTIAKYGPIERKEFCYAMPGFAWSVVYLKNTAITIANYDAQPYTAEQNLILRRFGNVFEQSYTRFLDLQTTEEQAREAQIELGLERVRARAMAMQKSEELKELIGTVFIELTKLDLVLTRCLIMIYDPESKDSTWWMANSEAPTDPIGLYVKYHEHPPYQAYVDAWQRKKLKWHYILEGEDKKKWDNFLFTETELSLLPDFVIEGMKAPTRVYLNASFNSFGNLTLATLESLSDSQFDLLLRFAKVFDLTYTRFNDLQKAEAQAREASIEASLERVRSKTIGMHNSKDVGDTVAAMFDELVKLGVTTNRCGILIHGDAATTEVWTAKANSNGEAILIIGQLDITIHPLLQGVRNAWKNKELFFTYELIGDDVKRYYQAINDSKYYPTRFDLGALPSKEIHSDFYFNEGSIFAFTNETIPAESSQIFKRFAGVFGQTYRRYLDLQNAEANAKEAQIEAALEKVRGKAMAMHNSNDLSVTASIVFTELRKLVTSPLRCGVGLLNNLSRRGQLYSATSSANGDSVALVGWVELSGHPVLELIYDTWAKNEDYYPELSGEQLKSYYESLLSGLQVPSFHWESGQKQYGTFLPFSVGCLYAWSEVPYNDTEIKILKRFAVIIDLTFRRYIELQKSEANAKEAIKQATLDRVRAEIASMRTIADLDKITPLIWNELTILGLPFIRCGVFIMDDAQQLIHTFLSTPDGNAIAAFHLPYNTAGKLANVLVHWRNNKNYIDHWDETAFTDLAGILVKQGAIASPDQYLDTIPHGGFYLHFLPFLQGMLYVGNTAPLMEDEIGLIQSVADAFSTAYARYEDFTKLEAAKQLVEKSLVDLKLAQTQLVQSEKMASLGELTAGIAHEIQNPLNFVNNFSEVSTELIDEMIEEVAKGNFNEVKAIAEDVKQNLGKINHHGKRADGIVKGMLQHSRTSSAIKESTDINKLAEEYLRLAYHGLRAKDKTFNTTLKTDFDESIGNINIIPQDIGRVILNLITNAFYVVGEKSQQGKNGYEPTVSVITKKVNDKMELRVKDNGKGIPQKVLDKIFQPFFTTKPTGQGTGLGLSLAYDIVKAHSGELRVETVEGEGSEFIVQLPFV